MRANIVIPAILIAAAAAAGGVVAVLGVTAPDRARPLDEAEIIEVAEYPLPPDAAPLGAEEAPVISLPAPGARAERDVPALRDLREETPALPRLLIPVQDVAADELRRDWGDARSGGRSHQGLDILAPRGAPVLAADSGTILKFFDSVPGGTTIYQSDSSGDLVLYYAHLDARAEGLAEGDAVLAGQVIGYVGTSGNAPEDAPHLHFEAAIAPEDGSWYGGEPLDPYPLLTGAGPDATAP